MSAVGDTIVTAPACISAVGVIIVSVPEAIVSEPESTVSEPEIIVAEPERIVSEPPRRRRGVSRVRRTGRLDFGEVSAKLGRIVVPISH
jgi:hypothetical protein